MTKATKGLTKHYVLLTVDSRLCSETLPSLLNQKAELTLVFCQGGIILI
jgi:hypothetical protein